MMLGMRRGGTTKSIRIVTTAALVIALTAAAAGCRTGADVADGDGNQPQPIAIGLLPIVTEAATSPTRESR